MRVKIICIVLLLLLLFLRRNTGIKVSVFKVKEFKSARDKRIRYKYTCGYFTEVLVKGPADAVKPAGTAEGDEGTAEAVEAKEERVEQKQNVLGVTTSTDLKADVGDTLRVKPIDLVRNEDGSIVWADAEVLKFLPEEEPDLIEDIRKQAVKTKK